MKIKIFITLVLIEIICMISLGWVIYTRINRKGTSLLYYGGSKREKLFSVNTKSTLKYFYEPLQSSIETVPTDVDWADRTIKYSINTDTLNNSEVDINENRRNIVVLGDSFTYGLFVETEKNYVSLLEHQLRKTLTNNIQLINLGVPGYDIQYSVERFKLRGKKYNPILVIWLLKDDDFSSINEIINPIIEQNRNKFLENNSIKDIRKVEFGKYSPSWIEQSITQEMKKIGGTTNLLKKQYENLTQLRKYYSGPILIGGLGLSPDYKALVSKFTDLNNGHYIELPNIWDNKKNYFPDLHPNERGHKIIADSFYKAIYSNKAIKGKVSPNEWFKF